MGLQKSILFNVVAALLGLAIVGVESARGGCDYEVSPADRTHGFGAATALVSVATSSSCHWTAVSTNSWITILAGASGTGNGDVTYVLSGNPNPGTRTGNIRIAGQDFTVTQTGVTCTYSISPTNHDKCSGSTTGSVQVTSQSPCPWTIVNPNSWIVITSGTGGTGSDKVFYTVLANPGFTARTGVVLIAGQPFTINQAPVPVTCTANKEVECGAPWNFDTPIVTAPDATIQTTSTVTNFLCGKSFSATRTWSVTDWCGNIFNCSQTVSAMDVTPPMLTCAANKSVECGAEWSFDPPTATDGCDGVEVTLSIVDTVTNAGCGQTFSATRTWRATDACGNSALCSQTVSSSDTTPPAMTCAANKSVECGAEWSFDPPTATDGCDGVEVTLSIVDTVTNAGCGQTFSATRTWRATDACGNSALCSQTVSSSDTTPPAMTCAADKSVECGAEWSFDPPTATDGCDANVAITIVSTVTNAGCGQTFSATRTWRATDACGNTALCSQTVSATDTTPPVVTCAANKSVECGAEWAFDPPTATDGCDANVAITIVNTVTNAGCGQTFSATRTWRATDACGNTASCSQTVSATDTTPPVITCAANKSVECGAEWSFDPPSVIDGCDANVAITIVSTVTNAGCGQTFSATRTWRATDACGNTAMCSQTVSATDTTPPVITCAADKSVECGAEWSFDPPSAIDGCDANVAITIVSTVTNAGCGQTFSATRTWRATDACGNTAMCSQTVSASDTTPPVITCVANKSVECGAAWSFDPPSAIDGCDANVAITIVSTVTNAGCGQTFSATRTWRATDACGNTAICSQTVSASDTTPPVITCVANKSVECGAAWSFDPPSAIDGCDANVAITIVSTVTNAGCGQTLSATRTWRATDACGNTAMCSQTVSASDTTPPVITCGANKSVECGAEWSFDPPSAIDGCDANVAITIVSTVTNAGCGRTFSATRTWRATDACGNTAMCSQTVSATDTTPPVITCAVNKSVACGATWNFDVPTAIDGCDANVTIAIVSTVTNAGCGQSFSATRTWRATDACGNSALCSQTVSASDTTAPVITCVAGKSVECGATWSFDSPTATDDCDVSVTITIVSTVTNAGCGQTFSATRTWRATDACGNSALCSQTVSTTDTTPPTLTCFSNRTVECGTPWGFANPTPVDSCGTNITFMIVSTVTNRAGFCGATYSATRTWRATDACGNSASCSQTVTVSDTTPPVITCAADKSVECGAAWSFNAPSAADGCDANVTITIVGTATNAGCGQSFTATRTWRASDGCGNAAMCSQTVSASDTTPPAITCAANKSVDCGAAWNFDAPSATDACDPSVAISIVSTVTNASCAQTFSATRTWRATDACGNSAMCSQTVSASDTTPPIITCAANKSVDCGAPWNFDAPTATDSCDANVAITIVSTVTNAGCGQTFSATRTWRATDACGNTAMCSQIVSATDTTPPVITCAASKSVECGAAWSFDPPSATDACDANAAITIVSTVTNAGCGQTFTATRTWRAMDVCGNAAMCSQTVQVAGSPLVVVCPANRIVPCNMGWTFDTPGVSSGCGVTVTVVGTVTNFLCGATYTTTRSWTITDGCTTNSCSQTVEVRDQTPPAIVCPPDITVTNIDQVPHCPKTLTEFILGGGATSDDCSAVHYRCSDSTLVAGPCGGVLERTHVVYDDCLNTNFCVQRITVFIGTEVSITIQPADTNRDICLGGTLTFCAVATGSGPFFYNWLLEGMQIPGAEGACLTLTNLNPVDVGRYSVQVISQCETVTRPLSLPGCGPPQPLLLGIQLVPEGVALKFRGLPDHTYEIQRAAGLRSQWIPIGSATTGDTGLGEFLDLGGNEAECRMYRLIIP